MDSKDFKGIANLLLVILFIAAAVLGPLIDKWRKKKEAEKRRLEGRPEGELEPPPAPARDPDDRPRLPYENVLEEVFGPYIERRRRAAQEAKEAPPASRDVVDVEPEVESDDEIRRMRETRRPVVETVEVPEPEDPIQRLAEGAPAEMAHRRRALSLDELLFRNPRLSPGAKLLLASEILGKPRAARR